MYGIMFKFPIQVSGISYLTLSINKGLVLVSWLEVFYLTVAYLTEISVILLLVLFLIILQGEVWGLFSEEKPLSIPPIVWNWLLIVIVMLTIYPILF